jgi:predicted TIM-barrel fold metal-dependent hydrolase
MSKHLEGRNEPILDADLAIIDSHHHLFVRPGLRYLQDEYLDDTSAGHNIVASVYVETRFRAHTGGPEALQPLGEIAFANEVAQSCASDQANRCKVAAAIVGYADLRLGDKVAETLEGSMSEASGRYRGVRQMALAHDDPQVMRFINPMPPSDLLKGEHITKGLRHLAQRELSFDVAVFHHQLNDLAVHVAQNPKVRFVLNHMGMPMFLDKDAAGRDEVFQEWRKALRALARHQNIYCKVGGLGLAYWGFGFDTIERQVGYQELAQAWRPYVEVAIESFGVDRCMMESDYPPDGRSCGFVPLWNALKHIVKDYSQEEKNDLFSQTAAKVYRIELPGAVN